jgi:hypothetical protein
MYLVTISSFFDLMRQYRYVHGSIFNGCHSELSHTEKDPWEGVEVARNQSIMLLLSLIHFNS